MVGITLRQLIGGHQKGGKFGKQVIKKIVLELLFTKCNENFTYSVSANSSALKLGADLIFTIESFYEKLWK